VRFIGLDLAWRDGHPTRVDGRPAAKETGVVVADETGRILDAGWERGIDAVVARVTGHLADARGTGAIIAVDAPLVVHNAPKTMRKCEKEVGRRYGRWGFSAYPSHTGLIWLSGVALRRRLEQLGVSYTQGVLPPAPGDAVMFECYPSTTIVGAEELGYDLAKPRYKTRDPRVPREDGRRMRAEITDELIRRVANLVSADPAFDLGSHPVTAQLIEEPSPETDAAFKHREDLLDAAICSWTAALWHRHGLDRCQVLGLGSPADEDGLVATIVAPARPEQRITSSSPPPSPPS
jgi:predicted RNase H-like nuclease